MRAMEAESVDAICTDPPYGLSFMGKGWDHQVPGVEFWAEALRVAKPGAHMLAFGGTRTFHRLVCAIEDAGWEVRDVLMYLFGSGFPKSRDIGKAIDSEAGVEREVVGSRVTHDIRSGKMHSNNGLGSCEFDITTPATPATPAAKQWDGWGSALKPAYEPILLCRKPLAEPTIAANVLKYGCGGLNIDKCRVESTGQRPILDTWEQEQHLCSSCANNAAPNPKQRTPETGACSAQEPANQQAKGRADLSHAGTNKTGTGCSDGMRVENTTTNSSIEESGRMQMGQSPKATKSTTSTRIGPTTDYPICGSCGREITDLFTSESTTQEKNHLQQEQGSNENAAPAGRWPSNLIHDGSDEATAGMPETGGGTAGGRNTDESSTNTYGWAKGGIYKSGEHFGDTGSAARYFYTAKASKADRDEGCGGFDSRFAPTMGNGIGVKEHDPETATPKHNHHPTVKPTDLMAYLCRLITPPDGVVLDPFCGSGSTGKAAIREGFRFIGIELDAEFIEIARARIRHEQSKAGLFTGVVG
jgi:DNA modification methylase